MALTYRPATIEDLDQLVTLRLEVLRYANKLEADAPLPGIDEKSRIYYEKALQDGSHYAILVLDGERIVGTGGVSFYEVLPTCDIPSGRKAYIMNMFTHPDHRRQGIAYHVLDLLMQDVKSRGITYVSLEATDMGQPLYAKYGFTMLDHEMEIRFYT